MPNYKIIKTLIMPPENYLGTMTYNCPPFYHLNQYFPLHHNASHMYYKPMAFLLMPYNYKHFTNKPYPTNPLLPTPLNPIRRIWIRTQITIKATEASASGPPKMLNTHPLIVVSILKWNG
jgi:hypothetical protein